MELVKFIIVFISFTIIYKPRFSQGFCYDPLDSDCGPRSWSPLCHVGKGQSPIDIPWTPWWRWRHFGNGNFSRATISFNSAYQNGVQSAFIANTGHSIRIAINRDLTSKMTLHTNIFPDMYIFGQVHCHWDSEHLMGSFRYPLECHFVHYNENYENLSQAISSGQPGSLLIFGILYDLDPFNAHQWLHNHNKEMEAITNNLRFISRANTPTKVIQGQVNIYKMLVNGQGRNQPGNFLPWMDVHSYTGSLTTPDCDEGMNWLVMRRPQFLSLAQFRQFGAVLDDRNKYMRGNFRPVQPLNGRTVTPIRLHCMGGSPTG